MVANTERVITAPQIGVLGLAVLGFTEMLLGTFNVVVPAGKKLLRGGIMARTGGTRKQGSRGIGMSSTIKEERSKTGRSLDRVVVSELGSC